MKITVSLCLAVFLVAACNSSPRSTAAAGTVQAASQSRVASAGHPGSAPADSRAGPPPHNYSIEANGEYGYRLATGEEAKRQGTATKAFVMVRYMGKIEGVYAIEMSGDAGQVYRVECKDPCAYVQANLVLDGKVVNAEIMPNTSGSLMNAIFEDALEGQLKPYAKRH